MNNVIIRPRIKLMFFPERGEEEMEREINVFLGGLPVEEFMDLKIAFKGFRYIVTIIYQERYRNEDAND